MSNPSPSSSFTGRRRRRTTKWTVTLNDWLARLLIAVGGIGTIVAVSLVCVFLVWVAVPLFLPIAASESQTFPANWDEAEPLALGIDEYNQSAWEIAKGGDLRVVRLDDGEIIERLTGDQSPLAGLSAVAVSITDQSLAAGLEDGRVRLGQIQYDYQLVSPADVPEKNRTLSAGQPVLIDDGVLLMRTQHGEFRRQKFGVTLQTAVDIGAKSPIERIDQVTRSSGARFCTLAADGKLRVNSLSVTLNPLTEEEEIELSGAELPLPKSVSGTPKFLLISELGDAVFAAWADGHLARYETRNVEQPRLVEEIDLVPEEGQSLTALRFLLGRNTLIAGDTLGRMRAWFTVESRDSEGGDEPIPSDGRRLVAVHEFAAEGHAVTSIAPSPRARLVAVAFADGQVRLLYVAAERTLAKLKSPEGMQPTALAISPKGNTLAAATDDALMRWDFDAPHPEATLGTLFLPVWYEGYAEPLPIWQSTGSSDASEAKLGLMPLVFGTLKATLYTMLFGAPLALLAAIYSSEFLHPRAKSRIKPTIEMMASLPSVVLGFLAGMVIAPFVEGIVPEVLTSVFTVPLALLVGAYLWQLLPSDMVVRLSRFRLLFILAMLPLGLFAGARLGPFVEQWLFAGNINEWLDRQRGSGIGGWMLLLLPLSGLLTAAMFARQVNPWLRRRSGTWSRTQAGLADLLKFIVGVALTIALALVVAWALDAMKLDPRGSFLGTYVQRNALIVGFAMGFAIIPLIYTIADDALSTVPEHLRSASLGAGATPWQTAVRIVIPTAASGLFSALMIGLGRAVGETMIVLMAAGNTPVMNWNIFEGFETLSMAIATELPEAAKNSTHYRTLFLAALTLFAMTFVVNTVAEMVRQRFRRRAYEL